MPVIHNFETGIQLQNPEVPEPGEWALILTALTGMVGYGWRRKVLSA